ncbi:Calcium-dependent lipid-binding family protein [Prunus dulcis]|uniref:Calcium-dependent lipid-binding family protein n=1 Tax=Prunus dulcis TaxID=3755 RepID=A0A5H2YGJ8_PRUDU|nr:Calcium-dependent lipid-binding family protein [Prunus dulcis]
MSRASYYVIIECGTREYRSKESSNWKNLTHLKFRIMDTELFTDAGFVGETIVHLGGIITEGKDRGFIELKPAPYNVVLEDDTYKGEIKIGFRFITNKEAHVIETREFLAEDKTKPRINP